MEKEDDIKLGVKYVVFGSEIGYLYCYDLGDNKYQEFYTDANCHLEGTTLVFDYCNCGFDVSGRSVNGDTVVNVREIEKYKFGLSALHLACAYGSKIRLLDIIIEKIEEKRKQSGENHEINEEELQIISQRKLALKRETEEAIKKYQLAKINK